MSEGSAWFTAVYVSTDPPSLTPLIAVVVITFNLPLVKTMTFTARGVSMEGPLYSPFCQNSRVEFSSLLAALRNT